MIQSALKAFKAFNSSPERVLRIAVPLLRMMHSYMAPLRNHVIKSNLPSFLERKAKKLNRTIATNKPYGSAATLARAAVYDLLHELEKECLGNAYPINDRMLRLTTPYMDAQFDEWANNKKVLAMKYKALEPRLRLFSFGH
jgi:hypothetical protein